MSAPNANTPSMILGHAQYAKGYVEETSKNANNQILEAWKQKLILGQLAT